MDEISSINEDELDISNIDRLQIQAIKEIRERIVKLEKEKQTKMTYTLPKIDGCNYSMLNMFFNEHNIIEYVQPCQSECEKPC